MIPTQQPFNQAGRLIILCMRDWKLFRWWNGNDFWALLSMHRM